MTPEEMADANKGALAALTEYKAHKSVRAARIDGFDELQDDPGTFALLLDGIDGFFFVGMDWMSRTEIDPVDGWLVIGADGQPAFSKDADFAPCFVADAEVLSVDGKSVVSREKLFVLNSQGEPVLKSSVPVVVEDELEPVEP